MGQELLGHRTARDGGLYELVYCDGWATLQGPVPTLDQVRGAGVDTRLPIVDTMQVSREDAVAALDAKMREVGLL